MVSTYKHLEIEDFVGEPTIEELKAVEEKLGAKLPASFVDFLKVANSGYLPYVIDIAIGDDGKTEALCFCELYGTRRMKEHKTDYSTFLVEMDSERQLKSIPPGVLPFARDGGSSVVFLDLTPAGAGRVVAFIQGLPAWTGRRQDSAFIEVAKSFDDYIGLLYLDPDMVD